MSLTWWNCERGALSGLMPFGQEMASGLRVPPKWEAISRPQRERPHRRGLGRRRVVPLTERGRLVAVGPEHLRERRGRPRNHAGVAVPVHRTLRNGPRPHPLVVAPGQERRPRRRADRRRVERVVADAFVGDARQRWGVDRPAVGVGQAEADVVKQDDEDVGRVLRQAVGFDASLVFRFLQGRPGHAGRGGRREGQDAAVSGNAGGRGCCDHQCGYAQEVANERPIACAYGRRNTLKVNRFHNSSSWCVGLPIAQIILETEISQ